MPEPDEGLTSSAARARSLAKSHHLSDAALEVLVLVIDGKTIREITSELGIKSDAVRKRLGEIYNKFEIKGKGPGKLKQLREQLKMQFLKQLEAKVETVYDWDSAPLSESLLGRQGDIATLKSWLTQSSCNLVVLVGMGGIGKTALSVDVAQGLSGYFEKVVWRSISDKQPLSELLKSFLLASTEAPQNYTAEHLIEVLKEHRYLIVLDGYDAVFKKEPPQSDHRQSRQQQAGSYREERSDFEDLLTSISQAKLQGCVLITSREKPQEILKLVSPTAPVRLQVLGRLSSEDARKILHEARSLDASDKEEQTLIERYAGNPLGLKIAADTIGNLFSGNIGQFLKQKFLIIDDFRTALKQQFEPTSDTERETLYWLAINRLPASYEVLQKDIVALSNQEDLLYTLRSLEHRSLIEVYDQGRAFTLQPAVMEYVTQQFAKYVGREIYQKGARYETLVDDAKLLNTHALLKAEASDYVRELQKKHILQPIKDELIQQTRSQKAAKAHLNALLGECHKQQRDPTQRGYLVGNLLNLLAQLSQDLKEAVFSEQTTLSKLTIRQAYLADVDLSKENLKLNNCRLDESVFAENLGDVIAVGFSGSETTDEMGLLVAGDANGRVHLWNARTLEKYTYWPAHRGWVRSVAFSQNGQWLLSSGDDRALRLWQIPMTSFRQTANNQLPAVPQMQWEEKRSDWDWVRSVAWGPDDAILACSSGATIYAYERVTGKLLRTLQDSEISSDNIHYEIATSESGPNSTAFNGSGDDIIRFIQFSPDEEKHWIVSCGDDCLIRLWDWRAGKLVRRFEGHQSWVRSVVFSEDGQFLVSSSDDHTLRIWRVESGECERVLSGHRDRIRTVTISPDDRYLASGSDDGTVRLWDFQTQTLIKSFQSHASRVWSVAFFRQTVGQKERLLLASGGDDQTVMVASVVSEPAGLEPIKTLRGYANSIRAIELVQVPGAAVDLVVGGGDDNDLKVWKVQDGKPLSREPQRLVGHMGRIWSVSVHVPSGQIATGSDDHSVRLWDLHTGQCQTTLAWHKHWVRAVTFSPDGKFLASAGDDRLIQLWKMPTVEQHRTLTKHRHWVTTLAFSRDSHYLASGSDDRQVILWDVQTGKQLRVFEYHQHRVRSVAFGPNNLLASASDDCSVAIWNLDSDQARPVHVFEQGGLGVRSVVFSGARWLLGGGDEPVVNVWRVGNWDEHYSLAVPVEPGQPFGLQGLSVSADEQYLVGCDRNGTVLIWSLEDRQLVDQIRARRPYENMEIKHVTGLGPVQKATLRDLGAIDETSQNLTAV